MVKLISARGIKKIKKLLPVTSGSLLIRAHGSAKNTATKARRLGYKIIDATCPMVKEIHKITALMSKKGYRIIVIGDHKHDEVKGIIGQIKHKAIILEDLSEINKKIPQKLQKAAVVVQSTQNLDKVLEILNLLRKKIQDLKFYNTICAPTRTKQAETKKLPKKNDCVIIIGSKSSANTKRLYEIAKSINKNSHWVNSSSDIKKEWFRGVKSVGITAGASTPDTVIKAVKEYIRANTKKFTH